MTEISQTEIGFNKPYMTGKELEYLSQAHLAAKLSGDGYFTKKCHEWLEVNLKAKKALLTQSCTSALEMAALLIDLKPGDEVIMPSFTFVSTANAFALRGAIPVFVDIDPVTLNIDVNSIEAAITSKTRAIVPVHYAGVSAELEPIMALAKKYNLYVIEDAAQAIMSSYKGRPIGSIGHLVTLSFHETKNIISGEGGALLINDERLIEKAEIIWEKGTNRKQYFRGQVDKYTWVNLGSSFLPSELTAAFLWAQLEKADFITQKRLAHWNHYHEQMQELEMQGFIKRPEIPAHSQHNGHIYYVLLTEHKKRSRLISQLLADKIHAIFHYVPLHTSPGGMKFARQHGNLANTELVSEQILRLPMYIELSNNIIDYVTQSMTKHLTDESHAKAIYSNPVECLVT